MKFACAIVERRAHAQYEETKPLRQIKKNWISLILIKLFDIHLRVYLLFRMRLFILLYNFVIGSESQRANK